MASVHRATYLDYVGVKSFGARGEVAGNTASRSVDLDRLPIQPARNPVLRKKVEA